MPIGFIPSAVLDVHENPENFIQYPLEGSSLSLDLEQKLSMLYPGMASLAFDSGMSAIGTALDALSATRSRIVFVGEMYRKTLAFTQALHRSGAIDEVVRLSTREASCVSDYPDSIVLFEAVTNSHLRVNDVVLIAQQARASGSAAIVDATLAGLENAHHKLAQCDLIVHSLTKYAAGTNDVLAGALWARSDLRSDLWQHQARRGGIIGPMAAFLIDRSFATYDLRLNRQNRSTREVLDYLSASSGAVHLFYPGQYENIMDEEICSSLLWRRGSVITADVDLDADVLERRISQFRTFQIAPSFDGVDSLVEMPALISHFGTPPEQLAELGIGSSLVRLSIGCEPVDQIFEHIALLTAV